MRFSHTQSSPTWIGTRSPTWDIPVSLLPSYDYLTSWYSSLLPATWTFPEKKPPKEQKSLQEAIEFASYYRRPRRIRGDETDSEWAKVDESDERQALRRAMSGARDWISRQSRSIQDQVLWEYDFDWTAPESIEEDG